MCIADPASISMALDGTQVDSIRVSYGNICPIYVVHMGMLAGEAYRVTIERRKGKIVRAEMQTMAAAVNRNDGARLSDDLESTCAFLSGATSSEKIAHQHHRHDATCPRESVGCPHEGILLTCCALFC